MILAAAVLLAASCNDDVADPTSEVEGAYILVSLRNQPLPAPFPCGNLRVQSAHLGLGQMRRASYQMWLTDSQSGEVVTFDATGTFRVDGDVITVDVTGAWSTSTQIYVSRLQFEMVGDDLLVRRNVGGECDASETEVYERGVLIEL
jgi:hypothetical protein